MPERAPVVGPLMEAHCFLAWGSIDPLAPSVDRKARMMMRKLVWNGGGRQFEGLLIEFVVEVSEKNAGGEVLSYISPCMSTSSTAFGGSDAYKSKVWVMVAKEVNGRTRGRPQAGVSDEELDVPCF